MQKNIVLIKDTKSLAFEKAYDLWFDFVFNLNFQFFIFLKVYFFLIG